MSQDSPNNEQPPQPQQQPPQYAPPQQQPGPYYAAPQPPGWQDPYAAAYPAYPGYPQAPQVAAVSTNTLAVLALISAFVAPFVVPVVLGHISMSQIRRTGEGGRGLAVAALVLGYIQIAFWVLVIAFIIWIGAVAAASSTM